MNDQLPPARILDQTSRGDCASPIIMTVAFLGIAIVSFGRAIAELVAASFPAQDTTFTQVLFGVGQFLVLVLPLAALGIFWRRPRYRAVFQAWALATVFILILLPIQWTGATAADVQAILHIGLGLISALALGILRRVWPSRRARVDLNDDTTDGRPGVVIAIALIVAGLLALPWLAWGALGDGLNALLQLVAALALGLAAGVFLELYIFQPLRWETAGDRSDSALAIIGAGTFLMILFSATGFSFGGMQLMLMLVLPSLAAAILALSRLGARSWAIALLVGLAAAAPMALIDADELSPVISATPGEILSWGFRAASTGLVIAWTIGIILLLVSRAAHRNGGRAFHPPAWLTPLAAGGALVVWVIAAWVYFNIGQPGFYGERLFVILKDQADVSAAVEIEDYQARRQFVYDTLVQQAETSQASLRSTLDSYGLAYTPYYLVNGLEVQGNPALQLYLESLPEVDRVLQSPHMRPLPELPPVSVGSQVEAPQAPQWNLTMIGADRVWDELGVTGEGIVVGQSDSGVQGDHPQLASAYRGARDGRPWENDYNWFDPWFGTREPADIGGHGTHTLGTILGQSTGVAPGATWFACVNLGRNLGNPALYLDCMQFMLAPFPLDGDPFQDGDPALGAHVINNSWGCPDIEGCDDRSLLPAVAALRSAGVFVVASAGNDGPGCSTLNEPLARYEQAFTVGAVDQSGALAFFSSRGPLVLDGRTLTKPDILAPGVRVVSSTPGSTYNVFDGTSMAGPHLVGVVALMWSANPDLIGDIDRTEAILADTAHPYAGSEPDCVGAADYPSTATGYGLVDAFAAVQMALGAR